MLVRHATPSDARALIALVQETLHEPEVNIPLAPDEFTFTPEEERERIAELTGPRACWLVAEDGGELIGELSLRPVSPRRALAHVATLGMTVRKAARRRGVGAALLARAIEWAPTAGFSRIQLDVYVRNTAAIALYEKMGFVHEGRRVGLVREGDKYLDGLIMARVVQAKET